jgi:hypothetical protein
VERGLAGLRSSRLIIREGAELARDVDRLRVLADSGR